MKAATFQVLLEKLGIQSPYSRPRLSNDNPYSEVIFRTLKYRPEFPYDGLKSIEDARSWTGRFVHWHTHEHQHSAINLVTPKQRHTDAHIEIIKKRHEVYQLAKQKHPERWPKSSRKWSPHESVALTPMKEKLRADSIN